MNPTYPICPRCDSDWEHISKDPWASKTYRQCSKCYVSYWFGGGPVLSLINIIKHMDELSWYFEKNICEYSMRDDRSNKVILPILSFKVPREKLKLYLLLS